jgi:transcriptional regulator with XRE-family HTH domain
MDRHRLGELIESARVDEGLTAEQLAAATGLTSGTLRRYEKGRNMPGFDAVCLIAQALNRPLGYFADSEGAAHSDAAHNGAARPSHDAARMGELYTIGRDVFDLVSADRAILREVRRTLRAVASDVAELGEQMAVAARRGEELPASVRTRRRSSRATPTHDGNAAASSDDIVDDQLDDEDVEASG